MSKIIDHNFLALEFEDNGEGLFESQSFLININRIGKISLITQVEIRIRQFPPQPGPPAKSIKKCNSTLFDPLGVEFTKPEITLSDLDKYRDLQGYVRPWKLVVQELQVLIANEIPGKQTISIAVREELKSISAPPLINTLKILNPACEFDIDLYRLGDLIISVKEGTPGFPFSGSVSARIQLFKPDGTLLKERQGDHLPVQITPSLIKLSRDKNGKILKWKVRIQEAVPIKRKIFAQVYDTFKIHKSVLIDRLKYLFGENDEKVTFKANWEKASTTGEFTNRFSLTLNDKLLAETFGIHDVMDSESIKNLNPGKPVNPPLLGEEYIFYEDEFILYDGFDFPFTDSNTFKTQLKARNVSSNKIKFELIKSTERLAIFSDNEKTRLKLEELGMYYKKIQLVNLRILEELGIYYEKSQLVNSRILEELRIFFEEIQLANLSLLKAQLIPPNLPSIAIEFGTTSFFEIEINTSPNVRVAVSNLKLEIGFKILKGKINAFCWIDPDSIKVNIAGRDISIKNILRDVALVLNKPISTFVQQFFARMMGGSFNFTKSRWNTDAMEFDFEAGVIPEYKQSGYVAFGEDSITPLKNKLKLEQSWQSALLKDPDKIKNIVVLMMENRSFDHVLGYLSLNGDEKAINSDVNGLTQEVIDNFSDENNKVSPLSEALFPSNAAGLKTKIPLSVPHELEDVEEQIDHGTMQGFVKNFVKRHGIRALSQPNGCRPQDVLGYYTDSDLEMYAYLAKEYTICDNFFSSHPGPTLPNRMFSLTGHLQYNRNGEPRKDNAVDDTFFLSRDQTIFDILSQYNVPWRVYESFPSVTMLRMFSKHAGDNTNIRSFSEFKEDIKNKDFPNVVFIDPSMHFAPINDDHPPADMLDGQYLIKEVYDALKSDKEIWNHTLFVITYDEHGGLFDHVAPPIAEKLRDPRREDLILTTGGTGSGSGAFYLPDEIVNYGVRVPTFLISPYVPKGQAFHSLLDHTSILKTILMKFCGDDRPFMSNRVHHANSLGAALSPEFRDIDSKFPPLSDLPDRLKIFSLQDYFNKVQPISKSQLTHKHADFHEFIEVLGRMTKPF